LARVGEAAFAEREWGAARRTGRPPARMPARAPDPSRATVALPGLGQDAWIGDLEIAGDSLSAGSLAELHFGDLVAFSDIDSGTTRFYRPGWISIGLVSHGPSPAAGHGIGVTILLTGPDQFLGAKIDVGGSLGSVLRRSAEEIMKTAQSSGDQ